VCNFAQIRYGPAGYIFPYTLRFHRAAALGREEEG